MEERRELLEAGLAVEGREAGRLLNANANKEEQEAVWHLALSFHLKKNNDRKQRRKELLMNNFCC